MAVRFQTPHERKSTHLQFRVYIYVFAICLMATQTLSGPLEKFLLFQKQQIYGMKRTAKPKLKEIQNLEPYETREYHKTAATTTHGRNYSQASCLSRLLTMLGTRSILVGWARGVEFVRNEEVYISSSALYHGVREEVWTHSLEGARVVRNRSMRA